MLSCAEEAKLGYRKKSSPKRLISSNKGGVTKPFKYSITHYNDRLDATKTPRPTDIYNLLSTFISLLNSWQFQLRPRRQWRVGCVPDRVASSVDREREIRLVAEGVGGKFIQDYYGSTQVWLARESPSSQGALTLTKVGCPKSTRGHYINN